MAPTKRRIHMHRRTASSPTTTTVGTMATMLAAVALVCLGIVCLLDTVHAAEQPIANHSSNVASTEVCTSTSSGSIGSCVSDGGGNNAEACVSTGIGSCTPDGGSIPVNAIPSAAETIISSLDNVQAEEKEKEPDAFEIPVPDPGVVGYPVSRYASDRREIDTVETVREEHAEENPLGVSAKEWKARTELAAAYRALYLLGLERSTLGSDQAAQCLMMRLENDDEKDNEKDNNNANDNNSTITFLMADWGVWFEEVTASNLLKFTVDGELIPDDPEGLKYRTNSGCIPVAKAIFEARPDVRLIVHIHPYACMAVGGTAWGLLPLSQAAFFLWGQVSREDYDFTYESSFEDTLAGGFVNGERAMLLNHHGMYAVGRDAAEALFVATHLTQACEVQVRTLGMVGGDLTKVLLPSGEDLSRQYRDMMDSTDYSYDGSREWPGILRKVLRQAPEFNT